MIADLPFREIVSWLSIISCTAIGCFAAYVFCSQKGVKGSREFLMGVLPGRTDAFYARSDFVLTVIIGTFIGIILYSPSTALRALAAGVGWTAVFNTANTDRWKQTANDGSKKIDKDELNKKSPNSPVGEGSK